MFASEKTLEDGFLGKGNSMTLDRITPARFKEIMDAIHRDCESVPCEATARKVLEQLKIEIADEIIPYDNLQAFNNLKPKTALKSKTPIEKAFDNEIAKYKIVQVSQLIFHDDEWSVLLLIDAFATRIGSQELSHRFVHTNGRPCGVIKS